ncbi:unnamed protein product [Polarella glacialis]|uniref:RNase H type-1 domain-containing protein n=1 Tax=Polarella glacialis TaxID=89957 RepID=A0A813ED09_POLGL|nr:unnamed protein product [Polarella glacialis]
MKVITTSGRPSALVRLLATTMLYLIEQPATTINPTPDFHILHGATDAGANGHEATIGGWFTTHATPSKDQVFWFSTPITKSAHPWAYHKDNNPQRAIAAIELYGTLVLQQLITHTTASSSSAITVKVRTDNKGNVYNVLNYKAKQWPNYAILMELALQQHFTNTTTSIRHVYREHNCWSDQLTHRDSTGFNTRLRIHTDQLRWHILNKTTTHPPSAS